LAGAPAPRAQVIRTGPAIWPPRVRGLPHRARV